MADNYTLQEAPLGSPFKAKQIAGVKYPGHILYDETGAPVAVATEATLATLRESTETLLGDLHVDIATTLLDKQEAQRALIETLATLAQGTGLKVAITSADGSITINVDNAEFAGIGLPADAAVSDPNASGSAVALLKGLLSLLTNSHADALQLHADIATTLLAKNEAIRALLAGTLAISAAALPLPAGAATEATLAAIKSDVGLPADAAQADPTQSASLLAFIKGLITTERAITGVAAITPSDAATFTAGRQIAINCTAAGNVKVGFADGSTHTFPVPVGYSVWPWAANQVFVTGTTAAATFSALK